ncbi:MULTISPECIES: SUKH-3 domain-containing protein [unclassified Neisseria]|uniref:SUKH-3 domain-containing protein n=1 Tax=unclassified Neisseria TaxID=2623750 RepID=UPI002665E6D3|nr:MULTISPECIES: SUKH-3 domain-containing protein [unclassified Neisseria]MDO1511026.1 SUKH-3 domain-containing protein [Neisseria sp. MVDL19-042950]MDO1517287.1 SUKH-3 domain-containing protein [Neisseria sp. MVDL18-041461]MDO1564648.1 SUKH-3 domain-containing protein [Neisseria sp. MVDL20-010259]
MSKFYLSAKIQNLLRKDGWYPDRKIDISHFENILNENNGYEINQFSKEFLRSFGNIKIHHDSYRGNGKDYSIFSPDLAIANLPYVKEEYIKVINSSLCPIGVGYSEHLTYFLNPKGEMFGGFESYFCRIGSTLEEAFDNIFFTKEFETLLE